jgi:hypothetical protein
MRFLWFRTDLVAQLARETVTLQKPLTPTVIPAETPFQLPKEEEEEEEETKMKKRSDSLSEESLRHKLSKSEAQNLAAFTTQCVLFSPENLSLFLILAIRALG